jgi:hypothetical protein
MSFLQQLWLRLTPPLQTSAPEISVDRDSVKPPAFAAGNVDVLDRNSTPNPEVTNLGSPRVAKGIPKLKPFYVSDWFLNDILFLAMLSLALVGIVLRLPVIYWIILTPVFGLISIAEGWSHFHTRGERFGFAYRVAAIWFALLLCIYLVFSSSVQGVLNANASSLAVMTLIALGTFAAGVQARVWQICGVGVILFLAVPGVGWLDQSPLLVAAAACIVVLLGGLIWWIKQIRLTPEAEVTLTPNVEAGDKLEVQHRSAA